MSSVAASEFPTARSSFRKMVTDRGASIPTRMALPRISRIVTSASPTKNASPIRRVKTNMASLPFLFSTKNKAPIRFRTESHPRQPHG